MKIVGLGQSLAARNHANEFRIFDEISHTYSLIHTVTNWPRTTLLNI